MSARHRTQAIVLKITNFREQDKLISFYTKEFGKIEILGKSIRKKQAKLRSFIQFPYFSEIDFIQGKNHKILTDTVLINDFFNLRKNFKKIIFAYKIAYILEYFIKDSEKDEKVWNLLLNTISYLNKKDFSEKRANYVYQYFLWNLLSLLGYKIDLKYCSLCQKKLVNNINFSFKKGLTHQACFKGELVFEELINILRDFQEKEIFLIEKLPEENQKILKKLSHDLICQKINK